MNLELKIYVIAGIIFTTILTLIFHFPYDIPWLVAFIVAALLVFVGEVLVAVLDTN
jgi:hypothetical protein